MASYGFVGISGDVALGALAEAGADILSFRLQPGFLSKYLDTPEDCQAAAAREVLKLPDTAILTMQEKGTP